MSADLTRLRMVAREYCVMMNRDPDELIRLPDGVGLVPRWRAYTAQMKHLLAVADEHDPIRKKPAA